MSEEYYEEEYDDNSYEQYDDAFCEGYDDGLEEGLEDIDGNDDAQNDCIDNVDCELKGASLRQKNLSYQTENREND